MLWLLNLNLCAALTSFCLKLCKWRPCCHWYDWINYVAINEDCTKLFELPTYLLTLLRILEKPHTGKHRRWTNEQSLLLRKKRTLSFNSDDLNNLFKFNGAHYRAFIIFRHVILFLAIDLNRTRFFLSHLSISSLITSI